MDELRRLRPGMAVWDVWHRPVGTVAGVDDEYFDLRGSQGSTLRVRADALYWVGANVATLICNEAGLGSYSFGDPSG